MYLPPVRDRWLPPRGAWAAAAALTLVTAVLLLLGTVGKILFAVVVIVALILIANSRLRDIDAEEFWRTRPPDD